MATIERIEPAFTSAPWSPSTTGLTTEDEAYVGKHRRPQSRRFSVRTLFYVAKHARR